jgi:hypothetical protein
MVVSPGLLCHAAGCDAKREGPRPFPQYCIQFAILLRVKLTYLMEVALRLTD